jgi:hypothetical protein
MSLWPESGAPAGKEVADRFAIGLKNTDRRSGRRQWADSGGVVGDNGLLTLGTLCLNRMLEHREMDHVSQTIWRQSHATPNAIPGNATAAAYTSTTR